MKIRLSIVAFAYLVFPLAKSAQAQTEGLEAGLRFANRNTVAIDFSMPLFEERIHAYTGFLSGGFIISGFYDWQFPFAEGFFAYPGAGTSISIIDGSFNLGLGGELGVEYQFPFLLTVGANYEPMVNMVGSITYISGWGIYARWRFSHLLNPKLP